MDLGISGRTALVCGSSAGIGRACAEALGEAGVNLVLNGRNEERLVQAANDLRSKLAVEVIAVVADVTTKEGREALLTACPAPDILINNAAGPPPGPWQSFDEEAWDRALAGNMIAPIQMIRAVLVGMIANRWGRIINITSSAVKAPLPMLGLSNGARSGLTGFTSGLAREVAGHGITINNLLPGKIETDRLRQYAKSRAADAGVAGSEMIERFAKSIPAGRIGMPAEMGAYCAFLSSNHAGFVTGQNLLVDGGEYPGL